MPSETIDPDDTLAMWKAGENDTVPGAKVYSFKVANESQLDENSTLKKQLSLIGHNLSVLECGCATGYMGQLLAQRGCTVTGVELNPESAEKAGPYYQQIVTGDLDFSSLDTLVADQKFDVILFGDVLEHLRNPWQVLKDAKAHLNPGGYVIASIPNIAHGAVRLALLAGKFEYKSRGILDDTHLRFFTLESVQQMFSDCGYRIDMMHRTIQPIFDNERGTVPYVSKAMMTSELLQMTETWAEGETVQFVIRAVPV